MRIRTAVSASLLVAALAVGTAACGSMDKDKPAMQETSTPSDKMTDDKMSDGSGGKDSMTPGDKMTDGMNDKMGDGKMDDGNGSMMPDDKMTDGHERRRATRWTASRDSGSPAESSPPPPSRPAAPRRSGRTAVNRHFPT